MWKTRSVENAECGKWGVWKTRSVVNAECGKCGVWKTRSVENKSLQNGKLNNDISPLFFDISSLIRHIQRIGLNDDVLGILRRLPYVHASFVF